MIGDCFMLLKRNFIFIFIFTTMLHFIFPISSTDSDWVLTSCRVFVRGNWFYAWNMEWKVASDELIISLKFVYIWTIKINLLFFSKKKEHAMWTDSTGKKKTMMMTMKKNWSVSKLNEWKLGSDETNKRKYTHQRVVRPRIH